MKRILILLTLLVFTEIHYVNAGNPAMLIRCRDNVGRNLFGAACDLPGFITYEGHCYPLADGGMCAAVPPFVSLVPMEVTIDDTTYVICVPDCSTTCIESCDDGILVWNPISQGCVCDDGDSPFLCGCPDPLIEGGMFNNIIDGSGYCVLPEQDCYNLGISYTVEPLICDGPEGVDTIRITIKPAGGGTFVPFEDAITIEDLENCDLIDGTSELLEVVGLFGEDDRLAFVADVNGCIILEFTRDPSQDVNITFLGEMNDPIFIPACPRVFDPCSCRPENITDANGVVLYWYDELTFTGNPNTLISVQTNSIPQGFLTSGLIPYSGPLGTTDSNGLLNIPFFRTPGFETDVTLLDGLNQTARLQSSCTLPPNTCVNIVPTLGEWSVMILGLLLMIFGVVSFNAFRKEKLASQKI